MTARRIAAALLAAMFWTPIASSDDARVTFMASRVHFVPEDELVTYYIRVPINESNRSLIVTAFDGEFPVRVSEHDLSQERRRTIWDVRWRLPAGDLLLVSVVVDANRRLYRAERRVHVFSTLY